MKTWARYLLCFLMAAVLSTGAVALCRLWPRTVPLEECSEIYRAYKDTPGVDVTFIRDFRVDDTVSVDVTLLQATEQDAWERMVAEMELAEDTRAKIELSRGKKTIIVGFCPKGYLTRLPNPDVLNDDFMAVDWWEQTVAVFHITDPKQITAIISYHFDVIKNSKKQQE